MPQELEIRTTILAKKSSRKSSRKDANDNDVYADEALQLLQEIQQLKSSVSIMDMTFFVCKPDFPGVRNVQAS